METERLRLLPWSTGDFDKFKPIATDPEVMRYINGGVPWTDDEILSFIQRQAGHYESLGYCMWKLEEKAGGRLIGFCGLQPLELDGAREIEIGWWLARDRWGLGLATEAARCALPAAVGKAGLRRVIAIAMPANAASRHVMEKLGLRYQRDTVRRGFPVVVYAACFDPASV